MNKLSTNMDIQRTTFIESLNNSLKKQAQSAIEDNDRFVTIAKSYLNDGLDESECVELLMIDGINRETAEGYISMAQDNGLKIKDSFPEYSFQFEDSYGKIWSSFDVGKTVCANNDDDAWLKAEELIHSDPSLEFQNVTSVKRIN